jgi:hypothetical protein
VDKELKLNTNDNGNALILTQRRKGAEEGNVTRSGEGSTEGNEKPKGHPPSPERAMADRYRGKVLTLLTSLIINN